MARCFTGSILHVNLSEETTSIENPTDEFYRLYGGGSGMGLYYILREMPRGADALAPENVLTMFSGLATGLPISGQSRLSINARSPLTGAIGDSQGGGFFPAALKNAGFDGIVVRGKASHPVYLYIKDGQAEIRDASHLWGKVTGEVDDLLKQELADPKIEVLQIGPAGENLSRLAAVMSMSNRANGRTGMGAVMGSKLLKAVVVRGSQKMQAADPKTITRMNREGAKRIGDMIDMKGLGINGTSDGLPFLNAIGSLPTRNYTEGQFEACMDISGEHLTETILVNRDTCYACAVRCKRVVDTTYAGKKVEPRYGGPEYETIAVFGSYCGVNDLSAISLANQYCNMYGLDTIGTGASIAFAMECFENGLLTLQDTGGLDLRFGNAEAMIGMVEKIARREGLGDWLADGSASTARKIGKNASDYLATAKNQEAPAHAPQSKKSLALIYSVNPFGADHQSSEHDPYYEEGGADNYYQHLAEINLEKIQAPGTMDDEKVRFAFLTECFYSALDTYNLCQFVWGPAWTLYGPKDTAEMLSAATGWDISVDEILRVGERRLNMLRAFNTREGLTRKEDTLSKKFFKSLKGTGPSAGVAVDQAELEHQKDVYYALAGWDVGRGVPTRESLKRLELEWVEL